LIGQLRAVRALLRVEPYGRGELAVELREWPPTTDPRSGAPLTVPPLAILWLAERPLAVRVRDVVAVSRVAPDPALTNLVQGETAAAGLAVRRLDEAALWRLFSRPPRPRLAVGG
jgi:hypothetical protein